MKPIVLVLFLIYLQTTLWASMVFEVLQCTFGTSFTKKKPLFATNCKITILSSTTFVTLNVKIHCHAMVHPCAKFEAIWVTFALDLVMIHLICLTCNEPSTMLFIFVKRCVIHLLYLLCKKKTLFTTNCKDPSEVNPSTKG